MKENRRKLRQCATMMVIYHSKSKKKKIQDAGCVNCLLNCSKSPHMTDNLLSSRDMYVVDGSMISSFWLQNLRDVYQSPTRTGRFVPYVPENSWFRIDPGSPEPMLAFPPIQSRLDPSAFTASCIRPSLRSLCLINI